MTAAYSSWRFVASGMRTVSFYLAGIGILIGLGLAKSEPLVAVLTTATVIGGAFSLYVGGIIISLLIDMADSLRQIGNAVDRSES